MTLGIYTPANITSRADGLVTRPTRHRPGPILLLLRYVKPDARSQTTRFIVRVTHRAPRKVYAQQANNKTYTRTFYYAVGQTYAVASISWESDNVTVLSQHATKAEALATLRATTF